MNESNISRSDGRSAVACAAYRACEKLEDLTFGKTQDYTKKKGLEYKNIYAPEHTNTKLLDRQTLWNTVEKKEFNANGSMKANARLAKEYICALPHELTDAERIKIVDDFCRDFVNKHNVIVDACIHAPHEHNDETNNKNYHVHMMFTTRLINEKGELGKKQRIFNDHGPEILKDSRATFANVVNTVLENAGLDERIDHRSYKDQGLDFLEPTHHEGHEATALRRQYDEEQKRPLEERNTEIVLPRIALENDAIKAKNLDAAREYQQIIKGLDQEIIVPSRLEDQITQLENELQLTEAEEKELLAELVNLNLEEERLQEQQVQQIDNAYDDFIRCQDIYAEFANQFYTIQSNAADNQKQIESNLTKTKRWLAENKSDFYLRNDNLFYDSYHHTYRDIKKPDFYATEKSVEQAKNENWREYATEVEQLAKEYDIENVVQRLGQCSEILENNGIERPTIKPSFWQKLKREYVHSFDTLHDFNDDMSPLLKAKRADDLKIEQERMQQVRQAEVDRQRRIENDRRESEFREQLRKEREQKEQRYEQERHEREHLAFLKRQELEKQQKNEPKKPENENNNDYRPW